MIEKLDYSVNYTINFPISKKDYNKIEEKNGIRVNVFGYENKQTMSNTYIQRGFRNGIEPIAIR